MHVAVNGAQVVLTGNVATSSRHDEVLELARRTLDGHDVVDSITVLRMPEPDGDGREAIG